MSDLQSDARSDSHNSFRISTSTASSSTVPTFEEVESEHDAYGYTGYRPLTFADFPDFYRDHRSALPKDNLEVHPNLLADNTKRSTALKVLIAALAIAFVALLVWQILIASCTVTSFCETIDQGSQPFTNYLFRTFLFRVPSALIWLGLTTGSLCLLVVAILVYSILRKSLGTARAAEVSTIMRNGTNTFVVHNYVALLVPTGIITVLLGVGVNWKTAGCFFIGAFTTILAIHAALSVLSRGQARVPNVEDGGVTGGLYIAFRTAAVIYLSIFAVALMTASALYLMFSDVRALPGLAAGVTVVGLFVALTSAVFSHAANRGVALLTNTNRRSLALDDRRSAPHMVAYVASGVGSIIWTASDFLCSVVCAVIATAILGSALPFFYRDSFALCVFNHLSIDQHCGPFGYPEVLSYATYICNNDKLYLQYPSLTTWSSNSVFVAIPFVIGSVGLLVSMACSFYARFSEQSGPDADSANTVVTGVRRRLLINIVCGYVLFIVCCAGVVFGLLGVNSEFQKPDGFSAAGNLPRMQLDGSDNQCVPKFLNSTSSSMANPQPVPQGAVLISDRYRPVSVSGVRLGSADSTAWRLFGCILIGVVATCLTTAICTDKLTCYSAAATRRLVQIIAREGHTAAILQATGSSLLSVLFPAIAILVSILFAHILCGAYGVGIMTLGFVCCVGCAMSVSMMGLVADSANHVMHCTQPSASKLRYSESLSLLGSRLGAIRTSYLNNASILTSMTLVLGVLQESNIVPSPRELIGSPERPPSRLISTIEAAAVTNVSTHLSGLIGTVLPFVLCGSMILSSLAASDWMLKFFRDRSVGSKYSRMFSKTALVSVLNSYIPISQSVISPIAAGFIHGHKGLVSFLVSLAVTSYVLSCFFSTLGVSWNSAQKWMVARRTRDGAKKQDMEVRAPPHVPSQEVNALRDCMSPALVTSSKLAGAVALVSVQVMWADESRAWIGHAVNGTWLLSVGAFLWTGAMLSKKWKGKNESGGEEEESGGGWGERVVSPFYEEGYKIDLEQVAAGSEIHGRVFKMMGQTGGYGVPKYLVLKNGDVSLKEDRLGVNENEEVSEEELDEITIR